MKSQISKLTSKLKDAENEKLQNNQMNDKTEKTDERHKKLSIIQTNKQKSKHIEYELSKEVKLVNEMLKEVEKITTETQNILKKSNQTP